MADETVSSLSRLLRKWRRKDRGDGTYAPMVHIASTDVALSSTGITGDVAHDAADSGNPIKIGGRARSAVGTSVANNDRVDAYFDLEGRLHIVFDGPGGAVKVSAQSAMAAADLAMMVGNPVFGAVDDASVPTDAVGSLNAHARGQVAILASVKEASYGGALRVVQAAPLDTLNDGVTQSTDRASAIVAGVSTPLQVKQAAISAATGADRALVAAVATKKIRVLSISFTNASAFTATFKSAAAALITSMPFAANGGLSQNYVPGFFVETVAGEALNVNVSAGTLVGTLSYVEV